MHIYIHTYYTWFWQCIWVCNSPSTSDLGLFWWGVDDLVSTQLWDIACVHNPRYINFPTMDAHITDPKTIEHVEVNIGNWPVHIIMSEWWIETNYQQVPGHPAKFQSFPIIWSWFSHDGHSCTYSKVPPWSMDHWWLKCFGLFRFQWIPFSDGQEKWVFHVEQMW